MVFYARHRLVTAAKIANGDHLGRIQQVDLKNKRIGAPDRSRTCGLTLRRGALYPTELRVRGAQYTQI